MVYGVFSSASIAGPSTTTLAALPAKEEEEGPFRYHGAMIRRKVDPENWSVRPRAKRSFQNKADIIMVRAVEWTDRGDSDPFRPTAR